MATSSLDLEKEKLIDQIIVITNKLIESTKSRRISIKLRTLLRYAYVSYIKKTTDISVIRGLVPRIRPPARLTNQYYYREIERALKQKFNARIENRRQFRYVVFYKTK